jgi:hypothetical protein
MAVEFQNDRFSLDFLKNYIEMVLKDGGLLDMNKQFAIDQGKHEAATMYLDAASSLGGAAATLTCWGIGMGKSRGISKELDKCTTQVGHLDKNHEIISNLKDPGKVGSSVHKESTPTLTDKTAEGKAKIEEYHSESYKEALKRKEIDDINSMGESDRRKVLTRIETQRDELEKQRNTLSNQLSYNSNMFNTIGQGATSVVKGGMDIGKGAETTYKADQEAMKTVENTLISMINSQTIENFSKNANINKQSMDAYAQAWIGVAEASHRG